VAVVLTRPAQFRLGCCCPPTDSDLGEGDEGEWDEDWEDEEAEEDDDDDDGSFLTPTARQIPDSQKTVNFTQVGQLQHAHSAQYAVPLVPAWDMHTV
jgi:hypothetical protein